MAEQIMGKPLSNQELWQITGYSGSKIGSILQIRAQLLPKGPSIDEPARIDGDQHVIAKKHDKGRANGLVALHEDVWKTRFDPSDSWGGCDLIRQVQVAEGQVLWYSTAKKRKYSKGANHG